MKTTESTYSALTKAYKHFNKTLFANQLPECLFTFQRKNKAYGYFASCRFAITTDNSKIDEIAMNPSLMKDRPIKETLSTLVHEMTHLQQFHFGKPSANGYHNKEWAGLMAAVGLIASNTGKPGGKQTGSQMTHYIEPNGKFEIACESLLKTGFTIPVKELWSDEDKKKAKKKAASKTKFTCPDCDANVWGKPDTLVNCGVCDIAMEILD